MAKSGGSTKHRSSGTGSHGDHPPKERIVTEASLEEITAQVERLEKQILSPSITGDRKEVKAGPAPAKTDPTDWRKKAEEVLQLIERQLARAEETKRETEKRTAQCEKREAALQGREAAVQRREADVKAERSRLLAEQERLEGEKRGLTEQIRWLEGVKEQEQQFREALLALTKEATDGTADALIDLTAHAASLRGEFQARMAEQAEAGLRGLLEEQKQVREEREQSAKDRLDLEKSRREVRRERLRLTADEEMLGEDRKALDRLIGERAGADLDRLRLEKESYVRRLDDALAHNRQLQDALDGREIADRRFGDRTPDEIWRDLRQLEAERDGLRDELETRPTQEEAEQVRVLERSREAWEVERSEMKRKEQELQKRLSDHRLGAVELETLRDETLALEASNQVLHKRLEELRDDIAREAAATGQHPPFPSCLAMDQNQDLKGSPPEAGDIGSLVKFVAELQHRIAYESETQPVLYYSLSDIRSFVAGLSMSYLTILQGISGTGKTSLPLHFARAVGGQCEIVEVQAGWRDRHDLLGHYNSFEHKYYESVFLQALYKAQCPLYEDRIFIILLDEMNLSYPEQYFADLISELEIPAGRRHGIRLMTETLASEHRPRGFADGGRSLPVPPNVWFIGTANQDETTKDFADKTYDRAHVIELPFRRPDFELRRDLPPLRPISFNELKQAFKTARVDHRLGARRCVEFLETYLREILGSRFGIGWGHRLSDQMERYVPVVLASGGSFWEALDYMLSMKVLRKIRNRYENREDDLTELRDLLLGGWSKEKEKEKEKKKETDPYVDMGKSLVIIDEELRRLRFGRLAEDS